MPPFASGLPEARQDERLRVTDAATARAPGLILQRLLDRQSLGDGPLIACLPLVHLLGEGGASRSPSTPPDLRVTKAVRWIPSG
jgi:hypothetical protein